MPIRTADATWDGDLKSGQGTVRVGSGAFESQYNFSSRFENGTGTNPEELIAAAHAGCFSMALAAGLSDGGYNPESVKTVANVHIVKDGDGFTISQIDLTTNATVPGADNDTFQKIAEETKATCPVSKALAATKITLTATLSS